MKNLLAEVEACKVCEGVLPQGPRPVIRIGAASKILVIGQAPGTKVHASGIPWDDQSGKELRRWLGVSTEEFYDISLFGIVPMGFCYPGTGKGGDLPPRLECAPLWHSRIFSQMPNVMLTLLIGSYAQGFYLGKSKQQNLTETVQHYKNYLPRFFPLVHPSPRNKIWQKRNPWFEQEVVPELQKKIREIIDE